MANLAPDQLQPVNSWLEAVQNSKGYEDASLMNNLIEQFESNLTNRLTKKSVIELNQRQVHLLLAFLKIAPVGGACVRVGDFGGGNGYMCDFLRNSNPNFKIDYDVYETAEIAKNYNRHSEKLEINFLDIKTFGKIKYDLVILSCTLQYINNWKEVLSLSSQIANNVLLMRLPLTSANENNYFIQHNNSGVYGLSGSSWPMVLFSRDLFMDEIQNKFNVIFQLSDSEEIFPFKGTYFPMKTMFLETKN